MENFDEYDVGNQELVEACIQEMSAEGFDCASVDLILRMAKDGEELSDVADVLAGLVSNGHQDWSGELLRMIMWRQQQEAGSRGDPDYATAAAILTYVVDQSLDSAHKMCPHLVVYGAEGPDCYDIAFTIGHMAALSRASQAAKLLRALYSDESAEGKNFQSLVPCLLGTMIDYQHADWAAELVKELMKGSGPPDYSVAGWILAQHVFFRRPDWAAAILHILNSGQQASGFSQESLLESVATWGGSQYAVEISNAMKA